MRIFLSLNPKDEDLVFLKKMQDETREKLGFTEAFKIKWEHYKKLHITLFFLGEVTESKLEEIRAGLRMVAYEKIGEIKTETEELGAFPNIRNPRVIVCKVINEDRKVFLLNKKISEELSKLGFSQDKKFKPHITLGRVKKNFTVNLSSLEIKKYCKLMTFDEFSIVKSTLSFKGSEYEIIETIKLRQ